MNSLIWFRKNFIFCLAIYQKYTFLRFLMVGGLNTLFGYSVFSLLIFFGLQYQLATFIALLAGIFFNFFSYGNLVFLNTTPKLLIKFILVYALLYILNISLLSLMLKRGCNIYLAQGIIVPLLAVLAYKLNKDFVFRPQSITTAT